ncbi:hypothetical protein HGH93_12100 [Chitinophaga polysaccharea]|uniref:hypothetical protein n=1 Tax=Chitinophaga polysaccharea TaxID=1293035 RepID=UPI0014557EE2|nr:hypothetical protein [Chitinophaga polysaccharea]NLR58849.1 hypothetical protein [Chitinophaga polysaccharea]
MDFISEALKIIGTAGAALIGGTILGRSMERYKNKVAYLKKRSNVQRIALAGQHGWGEIQILYNKNPCNSLYVASLELLNESKQNLDGFTVQISVASGETIYKGSGKFTQGEAIKDVKLEKEFAGLHASTLTEVEAINPSDAPTTTKDLQCRVDYVLRNIVFDVPFLNRKEKASFSFLIDSINLNAPELVITFGRKGLEAVTEQDDERRKQFRQIWIGISSSFLFAVPIPSIISHSPSTSWAVWLTILDSIVAYFLAWIIYYIWIWIRKKS